MLRSGLVSAEQGQPPQGFQIRGPAHRSRVVNAVALHALQRAADIAAALVADNEQRFAEAERVARQIVAAVRSRSLVPIRDPRVTNTQYLREFRRSLAANPELESAVVHLEGLVGPHDALVFFDRALVPEADMPPSLPIRRCFGFLGSIQIACWST